MRGKDTGKLFLDYERAGKLITCVIERMNLE